MELSSREGKKKKKASRAGSKGLGQSLPATAPPALTHSRPCFSPHTAAQLGREPCSEAATGEKTEISNAHFLS